MAASGSPPPTFARPNGFKRIQLATKHQDCYSRSLYGAPLRNDEQRVVGSDGDSGDDSDTAEDSEDEAGEDSKDDQPHYISSHNLRMSQEERSDQSDEFEDVRVSNSPSVHGVYEEPEAKVQADSAPAPATSSIEPPLAHVATLGNPQAPPVNLSVSSVLAPSSNRRSRHLQKGVDGGENASDQNRRELDEVRENQNDFEEKQDDSLRGLDQVIETMERKRKSHPAQVTEEDGGSSSSKRCRSENP